MASSATQPRALAIIAEEHQAILGLFEQLGRGAGNRRSELLDEALVRLDIHQQLKRELLYPALEEANADAVETLIEGHEEIEDMLDELDEIDEDEDEEEAAEAGEEDEDTEVDLDDADPAQSYANVAEQLRAHFDDEEETLAELAGNAEIDLDAVGKAMETRREELRREIGETGTVRDR